MTSLPASRASRSNSATMSASLDAAAAVVFLFGIFALAKPGFESIYHLLGRFAERLQMYFRLFRGFVWRIEPCEILDLTVHRLGVEPFRVAFDAFVERRVDEHLGELALPHDLAGETTLGAERRDER